MHKIKFSSILLRETITSPSCQRQNPIGHAFVGVSVFELKALCNVALWQEVWCEKSLAPNINQFSSQVAVYEIICMIGLRSLKILRDRLTRCWF